MRLDAPMALGRGPNVRGLTFKKGSKLAEAIAAWEGDRSRADRRRAVRQEPNQRLTVAGAKGRRDGAAFRPVAPLSKSVPIAANLSVSSRFPRGRRQPR